ncbi:phosphoribosyl transferase domain protein [Cucurbitaria berberidis CBS 394.84]|uniref:Phosphoribosyl transferase domain protein n=1 Tax=Cucurbitaria berberidis CBS 394.84 TaxID=1168544 RepID=A0A9P4GN82_9PLEO|nr:phosphoribosyl transferase domain protein [Cucurbitaria berberidis CBS 394.84]KAF1848110.1 phosphoribosyl transferase domain protein [Cucurbitaria berberidis CBS 394.84]
MATLESLKQALRQKVKKTASKSLRKLSETQYSAGLAIVTRGSGWTTTYQEFITPQLSQLLDPLLNLRTQLSVLEIGPGPKSVLGSLPGHLRQRVSKYTAFEPNGLFATSLEEWLCSTTSGAEAPLPSLEKRADIHRVPFVLEDKVGSGTSTGTIDDDEKYDIILFCHSMYGMNPKHKFIEKALEMLVEQPQGGIVAVFHRDGALQVEGLVCHRSAAFPTGVIRVADNDEELDCFASFIVGVIPQDGGVDEAIRVEWRSVCRTLGRHEEAYPNRLLFSAPEVMEAFTHHATTLPELTAQVPSVGHRLVKNCEARLHHPASIMRPTEIRHVQQCVQWSLKHGASLTVIGGGHSGHCLWPNVVSVDMGAFDQVHILTAGEDGGNSTSASGSLVIAEAGCKTGDIIRKTMAAGVTVPLGSRPSVGAGLWLQGGIGHLARLHGLACDAIVGAIVVSVNSGKVLVIGNVPSQHQPLGSVRPEDESDLMWAIKGAGTNFGIVISVTFKAYVAPTYSSRNCIVPLSNDLEARLKLSEFDNQIARKLPRNCSTDAYLYWDAGQMHLGVIMIESSTTGLAITTPLPKPVGAIWGLGDDFKAVDGVGLFETELYVSGMHGGHGGGKTSSFKRCLFLKDIGEPDIADRLVAAIRTRPSPLCYLHLLQGGGAVGDVAAEATAFGCRDWDFSCVITGVWPRDQDGSEIARYTVQWVYNVAKELFSVSSGVYGADVGPDPRDAALAMKAFGPNRPRLARLKHRLDPNNVLAYACPLPRTPMKQKLILLVTGKSCAGKDYCAGVWASVFTKGLTARVVSISDATKREYAAATGADLSRLLSDRAYKEDHRPALTAFFQEQVQKRPQLPAEHFLSVVRGVEDVDVLLITGMRDEAPVATFSHLVPDRTLLEVHVQTHEQTRRLRRGGHGCNDNAEKDEDSTKSISDLTTWDYRPSLIFDNDTTGSEAAKRFAEIHLIPLLHEDLQRLGNMVLSVPDFPSPGIDFRHVLGICQQPGGLALCISLLQSHFAGDWAKVDALVCCEVGGFVYASALASRIDVPLVLIRDAGKLPPPTVSVVKSPSYISSLPTGDFKEKRIEMERDVVPKGASVVIVEDVLSTGETLSAMLQLLDKAGIGAEDASVIVVAEFPIHRGRELLRKRGFGRTNIQSLLVFGGA